MPIDKQEPPGGKPTRRVAVWKKILFVTVVVCTFFLVIELALWTVGVETLIQREDPFRGFSGLMTVFGRDGNVFRTRRATIRSTFNEQTFRVEKPANGLRIFCLGGSSSYGFPWGAEVAFTSILGELLAVSHPELNVEAVNVSGMSYAMHRLNIVADELLQYQPDVFIIYSGHNEFVEPAFFDSLKHRSRLRTGVEYTLAHTRLYSGMWSVFHRRRVEKPSTITGFDARVRRDDHMHVFSPQEKEEIVAEYRWQLERLVRRAQEAGVRVVLSTVPCNQRQWRPEASGTVAALSDDNRAAWSEAFKSGKRQHAHGDFKIARANLERAAGLAPGHAETQFLLGKTYDALGRWDDARVAYEHACDADASPVRRLSGINNAICAVASDREVLLVDVDEQFENHSEHGLVGFNLIEDYVHPTREGHERIAWHLWEAIESTGWLGDKPLADQAAFDRLIAERRRRTLTVNAALLFNQGIVLEAQGQSEAAIEKFREALRISPNYPEAMVNIGALLFRVDKPAEAVDVLERLVEIDPDNGSAHVNLGAGLEGLGRFEEAAAHYQEALRLIPDNAPAHNNLGNVLQALRRYDEAVTHHQEALRLNPDNAMVHINLGNALQVLGRFEEAVARYNEALQLKPDSAEAHNNLGFALYGEDHIEEAVAHCQEALRLNPDYTEAHTNLANALKKQGNLDGAIVHYREVLRLKPSDAQGHTNLGVVLHALGRPEEAVVAYQQALRIRPDNAEAHYKQGLALQSLGRTEDAITHYQEVLRIKPDFVGVNYNLGTALQALGLLDEALAHYQVILQVKPDDVAAHSRSGTALEALGRFQEALVHHNDALRYSPKNVAAVNNLAWLLATCPLADVRDGQQALKLAEQLAQWEGPGRFTFLDTLSAAHAEVGELDRAIDWQQQAIDLAPHDQKEALGRRLKLYQQGKPYRQEAKAAPGK
jgi:tetratricopeptide (TPR) repeat protein